MTIKERLLVEVLERSRGKKVPQIRADIIHSTGHGIGTQELSRSLRELVEGGFASERTVGRGPYNKEYTITLPGLQIRWERTGE